MCKMLAIGSTFCFVVIKNKYWTIGFIVIWIFLLSYFLIYTTLSPTDNASFNTGFKYVTADSAIHHMILNMVEYNCLVFLSS